VLCVELGQSFNKRHEFGHVMHGICSESTLSSLGGTSCERDFVEAPSQLFEEWCYSEEPLKLMAPELPNKYINILNKERKMLQGIFNKRQLVFGLYDMKLHSNLNVEIDDVKTLFQSIYKETFKIQLPESVDFGASFGHLMGGYSAGYYSYLWSLVYAKDMYKTVIKGNELNEEVGRRFRKIILARGGSVDSICSVREFLGREPNSEAFALDLI
jgi:thimet oligopeptidase